MGGLYLRPQGGKARPVITWEEYNAIPIPCGLPDPPIYKRARRARKGWAEEPGHIVHGKWTIEATRYYKRYGAAFSGWIVTDIDTRMHSDPLNNYHQALAVLLAWAELAEMRDQ